MPPLHITCDHLYQAPTQVAEPLAVRHRHALIPTAFLLAGTAEFGSDFCEGQAADLAAFDVVFARDHFLQARQRKTPVATRRSVHLEAAGVGPAAQCLLLDTGNS